MRDSSPRIITRAIATKVQSVNRAPRKRAAFENNTKRRWGLRKSYIGIPHEASCFRLWMRNLGKVWVLRRESHREWKRVSSVEHAKLGEAQGPHSTELSCRSPHMLVRISKWKKTKCSTRLRAMDRKRYKSAAKSKEEVKQSFLPFFLSREKRRLFFTYILVTV